jgi:hypothetical protein
MYGKKNYNKNSIPFVCCTRHANRRSLDVNLLNQFRTGFDVAIFFLFFAMTKVTQARVRTSVEGQRTPYRNGDLIFGLDVYYTHIHRAKQLHDGRARLGLKGVYSTARFGNNGLPNNGTTGCNWTAGFAPTLTQYNRVRTLFPGPLTER